MVIIPYPGGSPQHTNREREREEKHKRKDIIYGIYAVKWPMYLVKPEDTGCSETSLFDAGSSNLSAASGLGGITSSLLEAHRAKAPRLIFACQLVQKKGTFLGTRHQADPKTTHTSLAMSGGSG